MKKLLAAAMMFAGCAHAQLRPPPGRYVTTCGMYLADQNTFGTKWLQEAENMTLLVMQQSKDKRFADPDWACEQLRGVEVKFHPGAWWEYASAQRGGTAYQAVIGLTTCRVGMPRSIEIATDRFFFTGRWQTSSIAHEIVHVVQHCTGHLRWKEDGIDDLLTNIEEE